ncbi:hypothetical protein LZ757_11700 [Xylella fastidiosa subsp. morus]|uniref:hypothetical protein n=1 Tax=Xylella fastidiosa TaxID=2371 RepID=UPI00040E4C4C|nr:hypothetical protein [Xylella fastidiosa]MDC7970170.1 hypothetical protein [Xylella fastidiosa subsp. multiplex]UIN28873.1 hypothetical protein IUD23_05225 [Xylella fastidiosa subsp. morus]UIT36652.1 hypothetical protein LZ757_11700 [Xylella fastidiosa subsp. morus]UIT38945.1 hypothetical protein LZ755_11735 [Xylella fastidiosa subsp. morus]UIT43386.1 hypothetical protein LZ758_11720 [Xylella fastidiosa subsp. morus]
MTHNDSDKNTCEKRIHHFNGTASAFTSEAHGHPFPHPERNVERRSYDAPQQQAAS